MLNLITTYFSSPPYLKELDLYNQNPNDYVFNEEEVNAGLSEVLEQVEWDTSNLSERIGKKYSYIRIFKNHATKLTFPPYNLTHDHPEMALQRVIETLKICPNVRALYTKKGLYSTYQTKGYLWWITPIYNEGLTKTFYRTILNPQIHTLCIQGRHQVSVKVFNSITQTQPQLTTLEISVKEGISKLFDNALCRLYKLAHLKIFSVQLNDKNLRELLQRNPDLKTLDISNLFCWTIFNTQTHSLSIQGNDPVSARVFNLITEIHPQLTTLKVAVESGPKHFFDEAIKRLYKLDHLEISSEHLNDTNFNELLERNPNVKTLNIFKCRISQVLPLRHLKSLTSLKAKNLFRVDITNYQLLRNNKTLTALYLEENRYSALPTSCIVEVVSKNITKELKILNLNGCQIDHSEQTLALLKRFENLTSLSLNGEKTLEPKDQCIVHLAQALPKLQILHMEKWEFHALQISHFSHFKRLGQLTIGNFPYCFSLNYAIRKLKRDNEHLSNLEVVNTSPASTLPALFSLAQKYIV